MRRLSLTALFFGLSVTYAASAETAQEIFVSGAEIAQRANVLVENGFVSQGNALRLATEQVTRETLLYNLAVREGAVMSTDAVRAEMQAMWTLALSDADETGRRLFERAAADIGETVEGFLQHPEVVAAYQRLFSAGAMRVRVVERLRLPETASETDENGAVDAYLAHADRDRGAGRRPIRK